MERGAWHVVWAPRKTRDGRSESWRQIQNNLAVAIHRALKQAGIEIPFPQRDLHLRSVSPEARGQAAEEGESGAEVE